GAHRGVALQATAVCDLQPVRRDHVPADEPGNRDPAALDVRLDVGLRPDEKVAFAFDLPTEAPEHLPWSLQSKLPGNRILPGQHSPFGLDPKWIRVAVGTGPQLRFHRHLRHFYLPSPPSLPVLFPTKSEVLP